MSSGKKETGKGKKRKAPAQQTEGEPWTLEEKEKFVTALCKGPPYRHENGSINWLQLKRFIGSRSLQDVKVFAKRFHAMEHGKAYPEFSTRAAIDVWRYLADKTKTEEDDIADICIPQVLTVTALEPINTETPSPPPSTETESPDTTESPDYKNIYNYLSAVTRGIEPVPLSSVEAAIVLDVLENLIRTLSKSQTLIQREFLHSQYKELRHHMTDIESNSTNATPASSASSSSGGGDANTTKKFSSTNPFGIPFEILNFKLFEQCDPTTTTSGDSSKKSKEK